MQVSLFSSVLINRFQNNIVHTTHRYANKLVVILVNKCFKIHKPKMIMVTYYNKGYYLTFAGFVISSP